MAARSVAPIVRERQCRDSPRTISARSHQFISSDPADGALKHRNACASRADRERSIDGLGFGSVEDQPWIEASGGRGGCLIVAETELKWRGPRGPLRGGPPGARGVTSPRAEWSQLPKRLSLGVRCGSEG